MFKELLELLKSFKPVKNTAAKKHLVIQTVYGAAAVPVVANAAPPAPVLAEVQPDPLPAPVIVKPKPVAMKIEDILAIQQQHLQNHPAFIGACIKPCKLNKAQKLIGLTKQRALHSGVFMYQETIRYSPEWDEIKQLAHEKEAGIAKFELLKDSDCLQIITPNHGNTVYLVNKDCIQRKAWLRIPENAKRLSGTPPLRFKYDY